MQFILNHSDGRNAVPGDYPDAHITPLIGDLFGIHIETMSDMVNFQRKYGNLLLSFAAGPMLSLPTLTVDDYSHTPPVVKQQSCSITTSLGSGELDERSRDC